jgi:hypothetical protein
VHAQRLDQSPGVEADAGRGHQRLIVVHRRAGRHGGEARYAGGEKAKRLDALAHHRHLDVAALQALGAFDRLSPAGRQERAVQGRIGLLQRRPGALIVDRQTAGTYDLDLQAPGSSRGDRRTLAGECFGKVRIAGEIVRVPRA